MPTENCVPSSRNSAPQRNTDENQRKRMFQRGFLKILERNHANTATLEIQNRTELCCLSMWVWFRLVLPASVRASARGQLSKGSLCCACFRQTTLALASKNTNNPIKTTYTDMWIANKLI